MHAQRGYLEVEALAGRGAQFPVQSGDLLPGKVKAPI